jgi:hypothetical protein
VAAVVNAAYTPGVAANVPLDSEQTAAVAADRPVVDHTPPEAAPLMAILTAVVVFAVAPVGVEAEGHRYRHCCSQTHSIQERAVMAVVGTQGGSFRLLRHDNQHR